jgi:hypothetical protein
MSKHTATPWHLYKSPNDRRTYVLNQPHTTNTLFKGKIICDGDPGSEESDANMRFIVKAVNHHERLVTALRECLMSLKELAAHPSGVFSDDAPEFNKNGHGYESIMLAQEVLADCETQ